jgi:TPR repeat protein
MANAGDPVAQDVAMTVNCYPKAAEQGITDAQIALGREACASQAE